MAYKSWGNYPKTDETMQQMKWRGEALPVGETSVLPYGHGRSYGDSCLNDGGVLLDTTKLDRFISFDAETGVLRAEAGVSLEQILTFAVPQGWFLPVSPGTKYVSVAGAIANDIHGKNHHRAGTFGRHVTRFELLRSDGQRLVCSPQENTELFRATVGGLGLTGLILWAEVALKRVKNAFFDVEIVKFANLEEFFERSAESDEAFDYTVAWVDCLAQGDSLGRGLLMRGNHAEVGELTAKSKQLFSVPIDAPNVLLNNLTMKTFNVLYYHKQRQKVVKARQHYEPFFYPLDSIGNWNRIYGKRGFLQYQFVLPFDGDTRVIRSIFEEIAASGMGSFLAVLKMFGSLPSPGLMSFPRQGVTLALDFPYQERLLGLLEHLDEVIAEGGGRVYPAKDARMSASSFQRFYPQWQDFSKYVDPQFSSSFWRRVTGDVQGHAERS